MSCCTNTYDLGCFGHCETLEIEVPYQKTGEHCFIAKIAGNEFSWKVEGVTGENIQLSTQKLNEDGCSTFWIIDPDGAKFIFNSGGTEYDCFKITITPHTCGTTLVEDIPVSACPASVPQGQEGDVLVWDYEDQQFERLSPGADGQVLTSNGPGEKPSYEDASGGISCEDVPGCEEDPTVPAHVKAITSDQTDAMDNANAPGAANPFATIDDLPAAPVVTGANNGLEVSGGNTQIGGNPLIKNTTIAAGIFDYKAISVPEVGKTVTDEFSQDLFNLQALIGLSINGRGFKYDLTYDGNGDPESWLFVKVSNDTAVAGTYNATIGYINLATAEECYFEVTTAGLKMVTVDGVNTTGIEIDRVTEIITTVVNGVTKMVVDSTGVTISNLTSAGDRLAFANSTGLVGIKTSAQATAMLDNMVGDSGAGGTKGLVPAPAAGDAAANKFLKADGTWATAKTQTEAMCITIETVTDQDYVIFLKLPYAITITETTSKCVSGTATGTFKINSTALGGTANSVSNVEQSQAHASNNAASANDDIVVTVSANASCLMASLTVKYTYNLA